MAGSHVDELFGRVIFHEEDQGIAQVVGMQKFAKGGSGAPAGDGRCARDLGFMEAPDQRRKHVRTERVVVVAGAVQVGGHRRDEITPVLATVGLAELDAGDLGDGIPLVGGFQRAAQEVLLLQGLGRQARINAGTAEKKQLSDAVPSGRVDDVVLDGQVLKEKLAREIVVGLDAADLGGRQKDVFWPDAVKEVVDRPGVAQVQLTGALADEVPISPPFQTAPDGASGQAVVASDIDL